VVANGDLLQSVSITFELTRLVARPFTESTVTWNNQPAAGTAIKSQAFTIAANGNTTVTFTLTDAQMDDLLGDWGYFRITGPGTASPILVSVITRENAGVSSRPMASFDLKR
jgi:hypothetical protein